MDFAFGHPLLLLFKLLLHLPELLLQPLDDDLDLVRRLQLHLTLHGLQILLGLRLHLTHLPLPNLVRLPDLAMQGVLQLRDLLHLQRQVSVLLFYHIVFLDDQGTHLTNLLKVLLVAPLQIEVLLHQDLVRGLVRFHELLVLLRHF